MFRHIRFRLLPLRLQCAVRALNCGDRFNIVVREFALTDAEQVIVCRFI